MRAIWTGAIGFGLVNIPVKLYSATESPRLDLDMLDKKNHANIRFARINASTGKEVPWGDIVKGYKYDDEYVVLDDKDFEKASPEKSKTVAIEEFVKEEDIDSRYFDTPYYLEPSKGGERAYMLLKEALQKTGKVAIGTFVMRNKENICMLKAIDEVITLVKMRFANEVREVEDLNIPEKEKIKPAELKMAVSLIDQLTEKKFDFTKYEDKYNAQLMSIIEAKAKGKKVSAPKFKLVKNKTQDLMEQLKASLGDKKKAS